MTIAALSGLRAHNDPTFHDTVVPDALVRRKYDIPRDDDAMLARIAQYCLAHEGRTGRDYVLVEYPDAGDGMRTVEFIAADELTYGGRPMTETVAPGDSIEVEEGTLVRVLIVNDENEEAVHDGDIVATGAGGGLLIGVGLAAAAAGGVVPGVLMAAKGLEAMVGAGDAADAKKADQRPWLPLSPLTTAGEIAHKADQMLRVSPEFVDKVRRGDGDSMSLVADYLYRFDGMKPAAFAQTVRQLPDDTMVAEEYRLTDARDILLDLARDWRAHSKVRPAIRELVWQADAEALLEAAREHGFPAETIAAIESLSPAEKRAVCWNLVYQHADIRDGFKGNYYCRYLPPQFYLDGELKALADELGKEDWGLSRFFADVIDMGDAIGSMIGLGEYEPDNFADRLYLARTKKLSERLAALFAEHGLIPPADGDPS